MKQFDNFKIDIDFRILEEIDEKKKILDSKRPLPKETVKSLWENFVLDLTYNSNAIEGNTLTLIETKVVLEGITVGGKTMREHLEAINHKEAILFLQNLVNENRDLTQFDIKSIHSIVLKGIDRENAGIYRNQNVIISGAEHIPPDSLLVPELMEKLIENLCEWRKKYHPMIVSSLLHGEFVKIHPFIDGNGRTSRLLLNFEAMKSGFLPIVIKNEMRIAYYEALDKAHTTGNYSDFVELVCESEIKSLDLWLKLI